MCVKNREKAKICEKKEFHKSKQKKYRKMKKLINEERKGKIWNTKISEKKKKTHIFKRRIKFVKRMEKCRFERQKWFESEKKAIVCKIKIKMRTMKKRNRQQGVNRTKIK